jgi:hypothetical protein
MRAAKALVEDPEKSPFFNPRPVSQENKKALRSAYGWL